MNTWRARWRQISKYPSAVAGLTVIFTLILVAVYALASMPYSKAIHLWRGGAGVWEENPRLAPPRWINLFSPVKLPPTMIFNSEGRPDLKQRVDFEDGDADVLIEFVFEFNYDRFPREISLFLTSAFERASPYASFIWRTPDGREYHLRGQTLRGRETYRISQDTLLQQELGMDPAIGLFADPASATPVPLKGRYQLLVDGMVFEKDGDIDAKLVLYGQVHGLAGTDHLRRDLTVALLWGAPIALAFGFAAAIGSTMTSLMVAAVAAWFSRWVDATAQRINEVVMILPVLPILVMVSMLYSRSIWVILGVVIALGIFGGQFRVYRAMFLQIRESPYIESARAYGASNFRIVFLYLIPRAVPVLVPTFVTLIPGFVFLEATLAILGLGDPIMPTWGKVLQDAFSNGALYNGHYYWVLAPASLLMFTGLGFAMLGSALDRVFNPRLREQ